MSSMYESPMDMGGGDMMMQMYYYWGSSVTVLFEAWNTQGDALYYSITLAFLFLLAFGSECWSAMAASYRSSVKPFRQQQGMNINSYQTIVGTKEQNLHYFLCALFYTVKLILGYQLMLAVMTYNVGISIVIFSGAFLGNFTFARFAEQSGKETVNSVDDIACHL